jgi:hypothetical protein
MNLSQPCLVALAILLATDAISVAEDRPVNLAMEDQFQNRCDTAALRGHVVVLVYAGRHGSEAAVELGRTLHTHYHPSAAGTDPAERGRQPVIGIAGWPSGVPVPDVHVIPIACVPEVPKMLHGVVRKQISKGSPHLPVWLDFEGSMQRGFGIVPDQPNVLLIDTAGIARGVITGQPDEARYAQLIAAIDQLRAQAIPQVRTASFPSPAPQ